MRRSLGDRLGMATCLKYLSWGPTLHLGQFDRAEQYARESLAIRQELLGAPGDGLEVLGWAIAHCGRYAQACSMIREGVAALEERGVSKSSIITGCFLGIAEAHLGRYERAHEIGKMCVDSCRYGGDRIFIAFSLAVLGMTALGAGEAEEAWRVLEESLSIFRGIVCKNYERLALAFPGYAALKLDRLLQAGQCFYQALRMASEIKSMLALLYTLPGVASLLADREEVERAAEVYALAARYPFVANSRWFEDVAGAHVTAAAETLPPEVVAAAQERGRAAEPWGVTEELLGEWED
jgi:tetratricopeptide (TPR) repeat protein